MGILKGESRYITYIQEELVSDSMLNNDRERQEHVSMGKASAMQA